MTLRSRGMKPTDADRNGEDIFVTPFRIWIRLAVTDSSTLSTRRGPSFPVSRLNFAMHGRVMTFRAMSCWSQDLRADSQKITPSAEKPSTTGSVLKERGQRHAYRHSATIVERLRR